MSVSRTFPSHLGSNSALEELTSPPPPKWLVNMDSMLMIITLNEKAGRKQCLRRRGFVQNVKQQTKRENITQQLTIKQNETKQWFFFKETCTLFNIKTGWRSEAGFNKTYFRDLVFFLSSLPSGSKLPDACGQEDIPKVIPLFSLPVPSQDLPLNILLLYFLSSSKIHILPLR